MLIAIEWVILLKIVRYLNAQSIWNRLHEEGHDDRRPAKPIFIEDEMCGKIKFSEK